MNKIDQRAIATIRALSIDAIEKAKSGHPGLPLGTAPIAYTLWDKIIRHNPKNPKWIGRDRFVLSPGHGSALLYSLLHLTGYNLPMEELQQFRQIGSKTPGHPEYGHTEGVEVTTGPLGHGFAMGVGMALAETALAARYNQADCQIIDNYTYGIVSDGDLMEGISYEAASFAGTMQLGKLIYVYDDNNITIEGSTGLTFAEDAQKRFEASGWQVLRISDSESPSAIVDAVQQAQAEKSKPSLIIAKTHIGFGSPRQDSASAHGEPLGAENILKTKEKLQVDSMDAFYVPADVKEYFANRLSGYAGHETAWNDKFAQYQAKYPEMAKRLQSELQGEFYVPSIEELQAIFEGKKDAATRDASGDILQVLSAQTPALWGGSADLGPSNKTVIKNGGSYSAENRLGKNIHFGIREHAVGAICNGIALYGGFIPYGATFLVFADFMRPALRMAALMGLHTLSVFTHDSVFVGEDGPTHQPIEHVMSLRLIPNLSVLRPADALETAAAWHCAMASKEPASLLLTRQKLPVLSEYKAQIVAGFAKGAYKLNQVEQADVVILATGSEVSLALEGAKILAAQGVQAQVVSMPCWEYFNRQSPEYKGEILPKNVPIMAVEAGTGLGWANYTGNADHVLSIETFGMSGPGAAVYEKLGFTAQAVADLAKKILNK